MFTVGLIGLGYWGPNYARLIHELDDHLKLRWCCDIDEKALKKIKARYPAVQITKNYGDILKDSEVAGVVVVTPTQTHYEICRDVLEASKPVLVEKPLTDDLETSEKLVELSKKRNRVLQVDHIFLFHPAVLKLKELVDSGELGKIYYVYSYYTALGPIRKDVNALWDLAHHWIYVANYILDSYPLDVISRGQAYLKEGIEDVAFLNMRYPKKILVDITVSWIAPQKVRSFVVVGDKKMAVFDDTAVDEKLKIFDRGASYEKKDPAFAELTLIFREGNVVSPKIEKKEPLKENFINFMESVVGGKKPRVDGKEGAEVVRILQAAQASMAKNGKRIKLEDST